MSRYKTPNNQLRSLGYDQFDFLFIVQNQTISSIWYEYYTVGYTEWIQYCKDFSMHKKCSFISDIIKQKSYKSAKIKLIDDLEKYKSYRWNFQK